MQDVKEGLEALDRICMILPRGFFFSSIVLKVGCDFLDSFQNCDLFPNTGFIDDSALQARQAGFPVMHFVSHYSCVSCMFYEKLVIENGEK